MFICINRSWHRRVDLCVGAPRGRESKRGAAHHVDVELLLRHWSNASRHAPRYRQFESTVCFEQKTILIRKIIYVNALETESIAGDD
jgi:hypothetical protein